MSWDSVSQEGIVLLRALVALLLGGVLGWEREHAGKWAGLRTHMLVAVAIDRYVIAVGITILCLIVLHALSWLEQRIRPPKAEKSAETA